MNLMLSHKIFFIFCLYFLTILPVKADEQEKLRNRPQFDLLESRSYLPVKDVPNYREEIRNIVIALSKYAKNFNPNFSVLVREGVNLTYEGKWEKIYDSIVMANKEGIFSKDAELLQQIFADNHDVDENKDNNIDILIGTSWKKYLNSIDGIILNNVFCQNNKLEPKVKDFFDRQTIKILGVEHCDSENLKMQALENAAKEGIVLAADVSKKDAFNVIPKNEPFLSNSENIMSFNMAKNMLFMLNPQEYSKKEIWINNMRETNDDIIIINPFFSKNIFFSKEDIHKLKFKRVGTKRLVFGYMNLSEITDSNAFWQENWTLGNPSWLKYLSKVNSQSVITQYWHPEWKEVLGKYFQAFIELGFDGAIIDGLDNHMIFEELIPID